MESYKFPIHSRHTIYWAYFDRYGRRAVPLVILANGKPSFVIQQWIFYLVDAQITPGKLELYLRAVCRLYDLCMAAFGNRELDDKEFNHLLALYIDAHKYGAGWNCVRKHNLKLQSLGLNWKPTKIGAIKLYLKAINKFDKFQQEFHGAKAINPTEEVFLTAHEKYRKFEQETKWNPMLYLFDSRQHKKEISSTTIPDESHARFKGSKKQFPKAFPLNRFIDLVEAAPNPRDKMLMLLMGGGTLRMSEPLHILTCDVEGYDEWGQARVRLADPETGMVEWFDSNGKQFSGNREEYFNEKWRNHDFEPGHPLRDLMPRTKYGKRRHGLHSGWKGMTFHDSEGTEAFLKMYGRPYDINHLFWIDPQVGAYFFTCYEEYMNEYIYKNIFTGKQTPKGFPWHPWLFINISKDGYGYPLSYQALVNIWGRLLDKMELSDLALGLHSLRHMFGYYCANVLKLSLEHTQVLMHHSSIESTRIYYKLSSSTMRGMLMDGALQMQGIDPKCIIAPKTPRIVFPDHWTNKQYQRVICALKNAQEDILE
jgi:hypothetical protein